MSSSVEIRRWTRKEYEMLGEVGIFRPDERLELVNGILYQRPVQPTTAALVVEVSASSARLDREEKRLLYAVAGIPEYWIGRGVQSEEIFFYCFCCSPLSHSWERGRG